MREKRLNIASPQTDRTDSQGIDEIIGEIFKIESTALGIQSDTEEEKEDYDKLLHIEESRFERQLELETADRLSKLKEQLKQEYEEKMASMRSDIEAKLAQMSETFEANHERWADDIVRNIIKE